mmetsp:Transcript_2296/g.4231  ORF Transcript_2296/g.4231 Transcript_2296/m.4231 type:complete len:144 (-) Transcript_2296:132-563(-)
MLRQAQVFTAVAALAACEVASVGGPRVPMASLQTERRPPATQSKRSSSAPCQWGGAGEGGWSQRIRLQLPHMQLYVACYRRTIATTASNTPVLKPRQRRWCAPPHSTPHMSLLIRARKMLVCRMRTRLHSAFQVVPLGESSST